MASSEAESNMGVAEKKNDFRLRSALGLAIGYLKTACSPLCLSFFNKVSIGCPEPGPLTSESRRESSSKPSREVAPVISLVEVEKNLDASETSLVLRPAWAMDKFEPDMDS